jgi:hypothetical protein
LPTNRSPASPSSADCWAGGDGAHPALIIEDLSDARWPPPWSDELIDGVLTALDVVRRCAAPPNAFDMVMWRSEAFAILS